MVPAQWFSSMSRMKTKRFKYKQIQQPSFRSISNLPHNIAIIALLIPKVIQDLSNRMINSRGLRVQKKLRNRNVLAHLNKKTLKIQNWLLWQKNKRLDWLWKNFLLTWPESMIFSIVRKSIKRWFLTINHNSRASLSWISFWILISSYFPIIRTNLEPFRWMN